MELDVLGQREPAPGERSRIAALKHMPLPLRPDDRPKRERPSGRR